MPVNGGLGRNLSYGYIPLKQPVLFVSEWDAGAVVLGGGVAVTAAHASHMLDKAAIIGTSTDYDLAFFHTKRRAPAFALGVPKIGERVVSYAHYEDTPYRAEGVVTALDAPVKAQCSTCAVQSAFTFLGNAGPGYSGGPVLDAKSGKLLGIVFGYVDNPDHTRTIYAYPMQRIWEELKKIRQNKRG